MEGGERTWGRGSISLVPGDPLCHRQAPVQKLREKERDQVGKTVRCNCDCGLCGVHN